MFNKNIKLFFFIAVFGYAVYQFVLGFIGNGIMFIILSGMFLLLYFKNEILLWAMFKMRKQDMEGTKKILNRIKNPEKALVKKQQGYYNYLLGIIASQTNLTQAERLLRKALSLGLNMGHDLAMAKLTLAGIMMQRRKKREATILLSEAKKHDKYKMLTEHIKMIEKQLKRI